MVFSKKNKFFQNLNYKNLLLISKILINIEHFICYGTLLGITRDKNYFGEVVSKREHMIQAAVSAEEHMESEQLILECFLQLRVFTSSLTA